MHHCIPRKEGATKKGGRENSTAKKALTQKNAFYPAYLRVSHGRIVLPFCHAQVVLPSLHRSILRAWRPRLLSLSGWRVLNVIPQKLPSYLSCNICVFFPSMLDSCMGVRHTDIFEKASALEMMSNGEGSFLQFTLEKFSR